MGRGLRREYLGKDEGSSCKANESDAAHLGVAMLTAHLPSGYVLGRLVERLTPQVLWALPVAMLAAVLPDIDMFWFYFVDQGSIHHHRYWVHVPAFWAALALPLLPLLIWRGYGFLGFVFFAGVFLHLLLDSLSGGILWGAPFDTTLYSLVTVPATQDHCILSFLLHWSFAAEVVIWAVAAWLWFWRT